MGMGWSLKKGPNHTMYTPELHGGVPVKNARGEEFVQVTPKCSILKAVGDKYVLTGTFYAPGPNGTVVARSATSRWLSLTAEQVGVIMNELVENGGREVWMQETARMSYPCILVELGEQAAESLGLGYQTRIDGDGTIHENEIAISSELITRLLLTEQEVPVTVGVEFEAADLLSIEEGLAAIAKDGKFPQRSRSAARIDADFQSLFS